MKRVYKSLFQIVILLLFFNGFSQQLDMSLLLFSPNLKEKSNSIILNQSTEVEILSQSKYTEKTSKTVLVLNEFGLKNVDATEYYSKNNNLNSISATVYSALGKKIKHYRKSDFIDQSLSDGFSIAGDYRVISLKITPIEYPFFVVFESETSSSNTAFMPQWLPIDDPNESVAKSSFSIKYPPELGFQYKSFNFENYDIKKTESPNSILFELKDAAAFLQEEFSPSYSSLIPKAIFSLEKFSLEGVDGQAKNWVEFGDWMIKSLLQGTDELSPETVSKIQSLVGSEKDPIKKAKIVYKYVQEKVRYVSIQLGIGGWKPMLAKDVDRLSYGDCKALSNYTKALLQAVDVPAYYTIIYGGSQKQDIDADFFYMQGNHAVLTIPIQNEFRVLECTSQTSPFGYHGYFTDDRNALLVKPNGSQIIHTKKYSEAESTQQTTGQVTIDSFGNIQAVAKIVSKGVQFDNVDGVVLMPNDDQLTHYKNKFSNINNITIQKPSIVLDKEMVVGTENVTFAATGYAQQSGNQLFFMPNVFSQNHRMPQRYRTRINPFEVAHGFIDTDEITIDIPAGFEVEAMTETLELTEKFGNYQMTCKKIAPNKLLYKRSYRLNTNRYEKTDYEIFRKFMEKIIQYDSAKIILKQQ